MAETGAIPLRLNNVTAILLQRLTEHEDSDKLAKAFRKYMLIDDDSYKEVEELISEGRRNDVLPKLIACSKEKSSENWDIALNDPEFPVGCETRQLLKLSLRPLQYNQTELDVEGLLKNWEDLSKNIDYIGDALDLNIGSMDTRRKIVTVLSTILMRLHYGHRDCFETVAAIIDDVMNASSVKKNSTKRRTPSSFEDKSDRKRPRQNDGEESSVDKHEHKDESEDRAGISGSSASDGHRISPTSDDMEMAVNEMTTLHNLDDIEGLYSSDDQRLVFGELSRLGVRNLLPTHGHNFPSIGAHGRTYPRDTERAM